MEGFGKRLVEAREKKGFNQKKFAELLGITPTRLNYWEKDKREPDFFMFSEIVRVLEADANELLGLKIVGSGISREEKQLLDAYRTHTEMRCAINKMLDIEEQTKVCK